MVTDLYRAEKGEVGFYIQPAMVEWYATHGYDVYRISATRVTDVEAEVERMRREPEDEG